MLTEVKLTNFKCFKEETTFPLSKFNLLTGVNGSGKSTFLQALLLIRQSKESYRLDNETRQLRLVKLEFQYTDINYILNKSVNFVFGANDGENPTYLSFDKTHFISADRIGPQEFYKKTELPKFPQVGAKGELTINLLDKMREKLVNETLCLGEDAKTLITQTEAWLGKILNPLSLKINPLRVNMLELLIGDAKPSNVGFGYSSVLPIIVSGLIAQPEEKLIVENPEIHLHPKAQSALIQFLVKVVNTGVQVFVESHSDHILNALRIAVLKKQLTPEKVSILYFQKDTQEPVIQIPIQEDGRIETWPNNFFDQMDHDLNALLGI